MLIYRSRGEAAPFGRETETTPPHDITDQAVAQFLPHGPGSAELRAADGSQHRHSRRGPPEPKTHRPGRVAGHANLAVGAWARRRCSNHFSERFGKTGAVITAVDLLRGLGRLLGWKIVEVPGATGYLDTDYAAKGQYAIRALDDADFVVVHVEATDEASHEGHADKKIEALEQIDADIVGPLHAFLRSHGDYRLLVCPDHPTFLRTKTHSHGPVPFALCGTGITPDAATNYHEIAAARSAISLPGYELMPFFLG